MHRAAAGRILLIAAAVTSCTRDHTGPVVLVPASFVVASGNAQTGAAGAVLAQPFIVSVTTANGEPAGGTAVAWHVRAGGGSLSNTEVTTDDQGHAAVLLTLGGIAGVQIDTVEASVATLPAAPLVFTASTTAGPPSQLVFSQAPSPAAAGTLIAPAVLVSIADGFGNVVSGSGVGIDVALGANPGGASLSGQTHRTTVNGVASFPDLSLDKASAGYTLVASAAGLPASTSIPFVIAPAGGTISGTITLGSGSLAPPAALQSSSSPAPAAAPEYTPDELIVTYRPEALAAPPVGSLALAAPASVAAARAAIHDRLTAAPGAARYEVRGVSAAVLSARVRVVDATQLDQVAAALRQDPAVLAVERNGIVHLDAHQASLAMAGGTAALSTPPLAPTEPLYPWQAWHYGMIDLPRAWAITTGSAAVLVAVVDNGIRYDHPAVAANLTHDGYDFVSDVSVNVCTGGHISNAGDGDGYDPDPTIPADYIYDDKNKCVKGLTASGNHGLHVAGTIGAVSGDNVGVSGVNWTVRIRPVRVIGVGGSGSFYDIAQGILYAAGLPADNGKGGTVQATSAARIINVSLGGASGSSALHNAVIAATNAGSLVIAAAGNDGSTTALYPAAYSEALAVSAVGPDGLLASYSTHGSAIDIAAPGGDIADGGGSFGVMSSVWNFVTNQPAYDSWDGTSMATPHVSGVAALVLAQNPSLTAAQLRSRLTMWAVDAGTPGPDNLYGAGIVNARNSLTQSFAPPAQLYARLYDATTGRLVATVPTANGNYSFPGLANGSYWVYGGADENDDEQLGLAGRPWGTLGGSATPTAVTVNGSGTFGASFAIAQATELEPNNTIAQANTLPMPGTLSGTLSTAADVDVVRVLIAQPGTYTFETSGQSGACGFALAANTRLTLEDAGGATIASNDDIDTAQLDYCSRITATLAAGTYYVAVSGWTAGRYALIARIGP